MYEHIYNGANEKQFMFVPLLCGKVGQRVSTVTLRVNGKYHPL